MRSIVRRPSRDCFFRRAFETCAARQALGVSPLWAWLKEFVLFWTVAVGFALTSIMPGAAAKPEFSPVVQNTPLVFPRDFGAHPSFRNEWWYVTGWLNTPDKKPLGFQVTFFRVATEHDQTNPSRFTPKQLIIAHAALSDPSLGKLLHDQKSAREGFGLAYAREETTD